MELNDKSATPTYVADAGRYARMQYRQAGTSGLRLPAISLGLWHNFGFVNDLHTARALLRAAFDHGIVHWDAANNYGPPYGSAEQNLGTLLRADFATHRDELVIAIAAERGQTLAQMAIAWLLTRPTVCSVLLGASSPAQLVENVQALEGAPFSPGELARLDAVLAP